MQLSNVQIIEAISDKNARFTTHLIQHQAGSTFAVGTTDQFTCEVVVFDAAMNPRYSTLIIIGGMYTNAADAFEKAFAWVCACLSKSGSVISTVDNPCNDPFLAVADQTTILAKMGVQVNVTRNGT